MMTDEIIIYLMQWSFDHDFNVILEDKLSPHTPSLVDTHSKTIVVNNNWHIKEQIPFQFAHELGHLVNKDEENSCLYFSPSKYGIEGRANRTAIELLIPYFVEDKLSEQIISSDFMQVFDIPSYLEDVVIHYLSKYNFRQSNI